MKRLVQSAAAILLAVLAITPLMSSNVLASSYMQPAAHITAAPLSQAATPDVQVSDQPASTVITVTNIVATHDGWIDIHANTADGKPGGALGYKAVKAGTNANVAVMLDPTPKPGDKVWAMLHVDAGKLGVFEWPDGPDVPVITGGMVVMKPITITSAEGVNPAVVVPNQPAANSLLVLKVEAPADGSVAAYDASKSGAAALLGTAAVKKGTNLSVKIPLSTTLAANGKVTVSLVDAAGQPLFPNSEDANKTITLTDPAATNSVDVSDQPASTYLTATTVVAAQDGWLDFHANGPDNMPGASLGYAMVKQGTNQNVRVFVDPTPKPGDKVWAMLHYESTQPEAYNWPGPDAPVIANGDVVMKQVSITSAEGVNPTVAATDQGASDKLLVLKVEAAQDGWLVVHANDASNQPGTVLGYSAVKKGTNNEVTVNVNPAPKAGDKVWPMLHVDAGTVGTYEFPGADAPVIINNNIVMKQITITTDLPLAIQPSGTPTTTTTPLPSAVITPTATLSGTMATPTAMMAEATSTAAPTMEATTTPATATEATATPVMMMEATATPAMIMQPTSTTGGTTAPSGLPNTGAGDSFNLTVWMFVGLALVLASVGYLFRRRTA